MADLQTSFSPIPASSLCETDPARRYVLRGSCLLAESWSHHPVPCRDPSKLCQRRFPHRRRGGVPKSSTSSQRGGQAFQQVSGRTASRRWQNRAGAEDAGTRPVPSNKITDPQPSSTSASASGRSGRKKSWRGQ